MSYFSIVAKRNANKCAVIGCMGTGAAVASALSHCSLIDALVLIDPDKRIADGLAADLECALDFDSRIDLWAGDYTDLIECSLIILALGQDRLHENAHADLTEINLPIIKKAVAEIAAHNRDAIILTVSEPCDIMTYAVMRHTDLPGHKIMGIGTLLQTLYLRRMLGKYLGVDARQLDAMVLGQADLHGALCPDHVHIGGISIEQYLASIGRTYEKAVLDSLFDDVVQAFERTEAATGRAAFAIAHACKLVAECIFTDSNTVLPICTTTDNLSELAQSCISLPCLVNRHGARPLSNFGIAPTEFEKLRRTAARLHAQMLEAEQIFSQK